MDDGELLGAAVILAVAVIVPSLLALFPSLIRYGTTEVPLFHLFKPIGLGT